MTDETVETRRVPRPVRIFLYSVLAVIGLTGLALAVYACGIGLRLGWELRPHSTPSDEVLLERFTEHRQEFEELLGMLKEDRELERVGPKDSYPDPAPKGITAARLKRYRQLMRVCGLDSGVSRSRNGRAADSYWFDVVYTGSALTSDERGYVFAKDPPGPVFDSLDGDAAVGRLALRHIEGDWYLYRLYDP